MKRNLARRSGEIHSRRSCVLLCDKLYARLVIINIPNRYCLAVMWNGISSWCSSIVVSPTLCNRKYTRFTRGQIYYLHSVYKCKLFVICLVRALQSCLSKSVNLSLCDRKKSICNKEKETIKVKLLKLLFEMQKYKYI